jgi:hypothetical protein
LGTDTPPACSASPVRLTFGSPVHPYGDEDLQTFEARAVAESWRGWSGERMWRSLDSELVQDAVHDGVRRVTLGVALR